MNHSIDNMNYINDPRNCGPAEKPVLYLEIERDGISGFGTYVDEIELPTTWIVCPVCDGNGYYVNPSIDCNGLSSADFSDNPDFYQEYTRGTYDIKCRSCSGRTTIKSVDWSQLSTDHAQAYERQLKQDRQDMAEQQSEMAMGA